MYLDEECKVVMVEEGSVSEQNGIQANDVIIKVNNQDTEGDTYKAIELIQEEGLGVILVTVERDDQEIDIELEPDYIYSYYIGVQMKTADDTILNRCYYGIMETKSFMSDLVENIKSLFSGNIGVDQMMGPVGISEVIVETSGVYEFVYMMAVISLSLGVTNLLPIPALDGGKILILIIEAIRRKPMKQENEMTIQLIGFTLLIVLSLCITYNDILRLIG